MATDEVQGHANTVQYHWARPARAINNGAEIPLVPYPKACSACHRAKYREWSTSLHSKSVGPGLLAQLLPTEYPGFATSCYRCHAPLIEQSEIIEGEDGFGINPVFDKRLQSTGVSCAGCHMRGSVIYGPKGPVAKKGTKTGHNTGKSELFKSAEFCAACHQLDGGYELNGRVLTNTYNEWKASKYADSGVTCQVCHMPGRRHLWQGIHYPEMVRSGLKIEAFNNHTGSREETTGNLTITNTGVGHMFPTYVTPSVTVSGFLTDKNGTVIEASVSTAVIGRRITLDLSQELFDTRIAPDENFEFLYSTPNTPLATELVFEVRVAPDEFYNRFFASMLEGFEESEGPEGVENGREVEQPESIKMFKEAYRATSASEYLLYRKSFTLK